MNTTEGAYLAEWDGTIARLRGNEVQSAKLRKLLECVQAVVLWHAAEDLGIEMAEAHGTDDDDYLWEAVATYPTTRLREWFPDIDFDPNIAYNPQIIAWVKDILADASAMTTEMAAQQERELAGTP
jgi:hypothetical protein